MIPDSSSDVIGDYIPCLHNEPGNATPRQAAAQCPIRQLEFEAACTAALIASGDVGAQVGRSWIWAGGG